MVHANNTTWLCDEHGQPPVGEDAACTFAAHIRAQFYTMPIRRCLQETLGSVSVEVRAITGSSPRTQMDSRVAEGKLPLFVRASWRDPGFSEKHGPALHQVQCTERCTKVFDRLGVDVVCGSAVPGSSGILKTSKAKRVSFSFAVDFWFPAATQLHLPNSASRHTVCHLQHGPGEHVVANNVAGDAARTMEVAGHDGCPFGLASSRLPPLCTHTSASDDEAARPPAVRLPNIAATMSSATQPLSLPGVGVPRGPHARRAFRPIGRMGPSPFVPLEEQSQNSLSQALVPGLQPIPHHAWQVY